MKNLEANKCLAIPENIKRYRGQIRKVEKFRKDEMQMSSCWWRNPNRITAHNRKSVSCFFQQGTENIPSQQFIDNKWAMKGLIKVTVKGHQKG